MGESSFSKDNAAYVGNTTGTAQEPFVVKGLPVGGGAGICGQPDIQRSNGGWNWNSGWDNVRWSGNVQQHRTRLWILKSPILIRKPQEPVDFKVILSPWLEELLTRIQSTENWQSDNSCWAWTEKNLQQMLVVEWSVLTFLFLQVREGIYEKTEHLDIFGHSLTNQPKFRCPGVDLWWDFCHGLRCCRSDSYILCVAARSLPEIGRGLHDDASYCFFLWFLAPVTLIRCPQG